MLDNANTKMIYSKIQKQLFYMIPEKWNSIYLYASVTEKINRLETGELFFYYFPKGILRRNPVNSYEIPSRFNLDEEAYIKLVESLYELIKELRREFQNAEEDIWTSLTMKIENFHFTVEFCYDNENKEEEVRHLIWTYQNLGIPLESYTKNEKKVILQYLQEQEINPRHISVYTEPMYRNPIKNVVQYNKEKTEFVTQGNFQLQESNLNQENENNLKIDQKEKQEVAKQYTALPKDYTYKRKNHKRLKESKIVKVKENLPLTEKEKQNSKLEEQIEQQRNSIKSQILNHY